MKVDKRIIHSQTAIIEALLRLMQQYPMQEITVMQICQEADISRNTFYRLFKTKEEILRFHMESVISEIIGRFEQLENFHYSSLTRQDIERVYNRFYNYWLEHKELLALLHRHNLLMAFYREFCVFSNNSMSNDIIRHYKENTGSNIEHYYYGWYGSSICSILESWVERDFQDQPAELTEITIQLYQSINYQFENWSAPQQV